MVTHHQYNMSFISPIDWTTMQLRYSEPSYIDLPDESVQLAWNYTNYRYGYDVSYSANGRNVPMATPIDELLPSSAFGTSRMTSNSSWDIILTSHANDSLLSTALGPYAVKVKFLPCAPNGCPIPGDVPLGPPQFWSDPASWPSGVVPTAGQNVNITAEKYIVMDITPPPLGSSPFSASS
jgi:hypothetical protein